MNTRIAKLFIGGLLVCFIVLTFASTIFAAPGLTWKTERVYFDNQDRLVLEGYFYNSGSRVITWVNWHKVNVYLKQHNTNWWHHAAATFYDLDVYLYPGESVWWTFRIYDVQYAYFDYWRVDWNVNYNY